MNPATKSMLERYQCQTRSDYENAFKEIIQEIALLGLWRSKFFEHAAFYGGTALRILYGLDRFSEDLDFSLLNLNDMFKLEPYLNAIEEELTSMDFDVEITTKPKTVKTNIDSAFIKADTKEHLLKIEVPDEISKLIGKNDKLKIKLEIDTNPPDGFETEAKTLFLPIPFSVRTYKLPDLFAGKIHAILQRPWKTGRVKGRDYYDFVWYIGRDIPFRLSHLEQRMRQTDGWKSDVRMNDRVVRKLLKEKFSSVDIDSAKRDVLPFVKNPTAVKLWNEEFFLSLLDRIQGC